MRIQRFAISATKSKSLYSSASPSSYPYTLTASFVENSTNTTNNTSNITVTAKFKANGQRWSTSYNSTLEIYWHDNNTNTDTLKSSINFAGLSDLHEEKSTSKTFNVTHKSDGTLSGYAKAVFTKGSTTSSNAPASNNVQTNNTALTSIPRVSNISCTSPYVGDTAVITITRGLDTYTDTVTYAIGTLTGTIATKTSNTVLSLDTSSMANNIYNEMSTTSQSIQGTITIETFNGNTSLGTKTATFNLYAKESDCKPTVSFDIVTTDADSLALAGNNTTIINNLSDTSISYTITANKGASIVSKYVEGYSNITVSSPITTWKIETPSLTMVALDSRNFATSYTKSYDFVDYFKPTIDVTMQRTAPASTEVQANFQGQFFNGSFGSVTNTLTLVWKYRLKGSGTWTTLSTLTEGTDYTIDGNVFYSGTGNTPSDIVVDSNVFAYQNAYEVALFYEDSTMSTSAYTYRDVPKGVPVANWEDGLFNINGDLTISDTDGGNAINVLNYIDAIKTYSSAETQVGWWIDGKPVYRQIQSLGTITTATNGTTISDLKQLVRLWGVAYYSSSSQWYNIPNTHSNNASYYINVLLISNKPQVRIGSSIPSLENVYVFVEYTKTTDYS